MTLRDGDPACESCGGRTTFAGSVNALGSEPGARIYRCLDCDELTWLRVAPSHANAPQPQQLPHQGEEPAAQQLQQQAGSEAEPRDGPNDPDGEGRGE